MLWAQGAVQSPVHPNPQGGGHGIQDVQSFPVATKKTARSNVERRWKAGDDVTGSGTRGSNK